MSHPDSASTGAPASPITPTHRAPQPRARTAPEAPVDLAGPPASAPAPCPSEAADAGSRADAADAVGRSDSVGRADAADAASVGRADAASVGRADAGSVGRAKAQSGNPAGGSTDEKHWPTDAAGRSAPAPHAERSPPAKELPAGPNWMGATPEPSTAQMAFEAFEMAKWRLDGERRAQFGTEAALAALTCAAGGAALVVPRAHTMLALGAACASAGSHMLIGSTMRLYHRKNGAETASWGSWLFGVAYSALAVAAFASALRAPSVLASAKR